MRVPRSRESPVELDRSRIRLLSFPCHLDTRRSMPLVNDAFAWLMSFILDDQTTVVRNAIPSSCQLIYCGGGSDISAFCSAKVQYDRTLDGRFTLV